LLAVEEVAAWVAAAAQVDTVPPWLGKTLVAEHPPNRKWQ
jgi:hypothetical protein